MDFLRAPLAFRFMNASEKRKSYSFGVVEEATGSCEYRIGKTAVLAWVAGPVACKPRIEIPERAHFSVNVASLNAPPSYKQASLKTFLTESLSRIIIMETFPRAMIELNVTPLSVDGSLFMAAFNASMAALLHSGIPLKAVWVACTACLLDDKLCASPAESEEVQVAELNAQDNHSASIHACVYAEDGLVEVNRSLGAFNFEEMTTLHATLRPYAHAERELLLSSANAQILQAPKQQ